MGLPGIITQIRASVSDLVPTTSPDIRFDSPRPGSIESPRDWLMNPDRETRHFDVQAMSFPARSPGCLMTVELAVSVVYRLDQGLDLVDIMAGEDVETLSDDFAGRPSLWSQASSLFAPGPPETEQVAYPDGTPATVIVRTIYSVDYVSDYVETYHPTVVSFDPLGGQAARLTLLAVDSGRRPATTPVTIALDHTQVDGSTSTPAFVPRTYDMTSAGWTVSGDTPTSITTDDDGVAVIDLYYAGEAPGSKRVRCSVGSARAAVVVTIAGARKWLDKNNGAAADTAANGTEAAPYLTLVYALSQIDDPDTALVIPTAATYVEGSIPLLTTQAGIVGQVAGVIIDPAGPTELRWAGSSGTPRIIRCIETTAGYVDTTGTTGDMLLSGCTMVGGSYGIYARARVWDTFVSCCSLTGTTGAFHSATTLECFIYDSTMTVATTVFGMYQSTADADGWRSRNNTFVLGAGWAIGLSTASQVTGADSTVESDWNTYTGAGSALAYADGGATIWVDLAAWQAATGLDLNSTQT